MIRLKESNGKLYVFTHGRGIWVVQLKRGNVSVETVAEETKGLTIYPNPAQDFIRLDRDEFDVLSIMSVNGKEYKAEIVGNTVNIQNLPMGTYFLRLESEGHIYQEKFVKF